MQKTIEKKHWCWSIFPTKQQQNQMLNSLFCCLQLGSDWSNKQLKNITLVQSVIASAWLGTCTWIHTSWTWKTFTQRVVLYTSKDGPCWRSNHGTQWSIVSYGWSSNKRHIPITQKGGWRHKKLFVSNRKAGIISKIYVWLHLELRPDRL